MFRQIIKSLLPDGTRRQLRRVYQLFALAWRDIRYDLCGQLIPLKPRAISFMVNDICNAKCVMCLIWKKKREKEISADEFGQILSEPLFNQVTNIGFTGGEPTLRKDLAQLILTATVRSPRLRGVSIITNAIKAQQVSERVLACYRVCLQKGVAFNVMVSVDGLDAVHDNNRGRPGNFESALKCIREFTAAGVSVTIGCTITKGNVGGVDELLDWAINEGIYARFRVAEFIDRLDNNQQTEIIRNFTPVERHHLGLFFNRLNTNYEADSTIRKTYASITGMLTKGLKRATGCPYHTDTVILASKGELLYCSPKSPNLGSILAPGTAAKVYFGNLDVRANLRQNDCDNCIHDYHVPVSFVEKVRFFYKNSRIQHNYDCQHLVRRAARLAPVPGRYLLTSPAHSRGVLIVGWYGTETAGDKAILWGIVNRLKSRPQPPVEIYLSSFTPWFSEWTKVELDLPELRVIETYSREFERICQSVDEVVIGGGPLMDLESLNHMLYAFISAAKNGAVRRVEGCGLGPLRNPKYVSVVREILHLANDITLRDRQSVRQAWKEFSIPSRCETDPAWDYINAVAEKEIAAPEPERPIVNFFLRKWPRMYYPGTDVHFRVLEEQFEESLLSFIEELVRQHRYDVQFLAMSTFSEGLDDRVYNRKLHSKLINRGAVSRHAIHLAPLPMAPAMLVEEMRRAQLNVCMRYHAVLFATALNTQCLAIDYTCGGKISSFLADQDKQNCLLSMEEFSAGAWRHTLTDSGYDYACCSD